MKVSLFTNLLSTAARRALVASLFILPMIWVLNAIRTPQSNPAAPAKAVKSVDTLDGRAQNRTPDLAPSPPASVDYEALCGKINVLWKARNYGEIDAIAERRLEINRDDVFALGLKQCNGMFGARNIPGAHSNAKRILEIADRSKNSMFKNLAAEFTGWAIQISPTDGDLSPAQHDEIHRALDDFPYIIDIVGLWRLSNEGR